MSLQYNIPIKVLDKDKEWRIQEKLRGFSELTDRSGNLDGTCFSREDLPYVGEIIIVKTIKPEVIRIAQQELSGIEGLLLLPPTFCDKDNERKSKSRPYILESHVDESSETSVAGTYCLLSESGLSGVGSR